MLGRNLEAVFFLRCLQAALIAPIAGYTAWLLSGKNIWALSAGLYF